MTDADLFRLWYLWLAIGGVIVVIAASLLVTIWLTARGIETQARRALAAVERILDAAGRILAAVTAVRDHAQSCPRCPTCAHRR